MTTFSSHIFYQHQELFEKQSRVDELVDDLALTLGVTRDNLNIVCLCKLDLGRFSLIKLGSGSQRRLVRANDYPAKR